MSSHLDWMRAIGFTPIGYWARVKGKADEDGELLPWPGDLVDVPGRVYSHPRLKPAQVKSMVLAYLKQSIPELRAAYGGYSSCRICKMECNGSCDYSDGEYLWPQGYAHYVDKHAVAPPRAFVVHVLERAGKFPAKAPPSKVTRERLQELVRTHFPEIKT